VVLSSNDTRFKDKPLRSTEDLDIDGDDIYFVDSSYKHDINEAIQDIVHAFPGGRYFIIERIFSILMVNSKLKLNFKRLFRYNVKKDTLELLADKLYYPNGVQLTPKKDAILVNEFSMARIVK
jgi:sugar lactone lactonase YvrE